MPRKVMEAPRQLIEDKVRDMVSGIILKPVSRDDALFDSGLMDSIAAVHVALAIEDQFGCVIPATDMVRVAASIGSLADFVALNATRGV